MNGFPRTPAFNRGGVCTAESFLACFLHWCLPFFAVVVVVVAEELRCPLGEVYLFVSVVGCSSLWDTLQGTNIAPTSRHF